MMKPGRVRDPYLENPIVEGLWLGLSGNFVPYYLLPALQRYGSLQFFLPFGVEKEFF